MKEYPIQVFDSKTVFFKETRFFRYYKEEINSIAKIKLSILEVYFFTINTIIDLIKSIIFKKIATERVKKILIFRTGSIGDNVVALPAIYAIRKKFPNARMTVLTSTGINNYTSFDKIASKELYDDLINYSGTSFFSIKKKIKGEYDLVIELPQFLNGVLKNLRNMFFFRYYCGIKYGFGWQVSNINFFKSVQENNIIYKNEHSILNEIISKNLKLIVEPVYKFNISENDKLIINELINRLLVTECKNFNVLVIGANYSRNRWPINNFIKVAHYKYLNEKSFSIIIGAVDDSKLLNDLVIPNYIIDLCGKLSISQSTYLLSKANEVFSNDTGPMHIAAAVSSKLTTFFSCKAFPGRWFPNLNFAKVYRSFEIPCSICFEDKICQNNFCLKNICFKKVIN